MTQTPTGSYGQNPAQTPGTAVTAPTAPHQVSAAYAHAHVAQKRSAQAAQVAHSQADNIVDWLGALIDDAEGLGRSNLSHDEKEARFTTACEVITGQRSAGNPNLISDKEAYKALLASRDLSVGVVNGIRRLMSNSTDPEYMPVDDDGTPKELAEAEDKIVALEDKYDNFVRYVDEYLRLQLDQFAAVLGLGPVDNELTEDLRTRIEVAIANGAQPVNLIPAPPTTGGNPPPAQQPPVPPGTTPQPPAPAPQPQPTPPGGNPPPASQTLAQRAIKKVTRKGGN